MENNKNIREYSRAYAEFINCQTHDVTCLIPLSTEQIAKIGEFVHSGQIVFTLEGVFEGVASLLNNIPNMPETPEEFVKKCKVVGFLQHPSLAGNTINYCPTGTSIAKSKNYPIGIGDVLIVDEEAIAEIYKDVKKLIKEGQPITEVYTLPVKPTTYQTIEDIFDSAVFKTLLNKRKGVEIKDKEEKLKQKTTMVEYNPDENVQIALENVINLITLSSVRALIYSGYLKEGEIKDIDDSLEEIVSKNKSDKIEKFVQDLGSKLGMKTKSTEQVDSNLNKDFMRFILNPMVGNEPLEKFGDMDFKLPYVEMVKSVIILYERYKNKIIGRSVSSTKTDENCNLIRGL
jgi:hypothetical protein